MGKDTKEPRENSTVRTAKAAKESANAVKAEKSINWKAAAGIGVGSAAILAALIYANKARKKDD